MALPPFGMRDRLYKDSTPKLKVGDSAFEDWFQQQPFATQSGIKQPCRDAYAAGMGDPLVTYALPQVDLEDIHLTRAALVSAVSFLLSTTVPMTSQQKECWPGLKQALVDAMKETK